MCVTGFLHTTCILILFFNKSVYADLFSSMAEFASLLETQEKVIENLEEYIHKENQRLRILNRHLDKFKEEHDKATQNGNFMENPINSFTVIKRLTTDLGFLEGRMETTKYERNTSLKYPTEEDLEGAALGLRRLQDIYLLNATELANGTLRGTFSHENQVYTEYVTPMSMSECYEVGRILYEAGIYTRALEWLTEAFHKYDAEDVEGYPSFTVVDVVESIGNTFFELDDFENALEFTKTMSGLPSMSQYEEFIFEFEERIKELRKTRSKVKKTPPQNLIPNNYDSLCRGEMDISSDVKNRLKCRYLTDNPFLKLAPIKMEQLYLEPEVILFYDVMSDREIEHIKNISKPLLIRAQFVKKGDDKVPATYRISKMAWFESSHDEITARLSERTADITEMNMETAEKMQVANYGIGGHYNPHFDYYQDKSRKDNRIATVLFYMSDVAQGGATVFTKLGLTMFPVRGAALFWRNLHSSGEGDEATLHAACPVLRGDKWVLNRWIRTPGQELTAPCPIDYQMTPKAILPPVKKTLDKR